MMSNGSTFALPEFHDVILRHRLYSLLDSNRDKRLVLVQGQAAQGKSTLIASYLGNISLKSTEQTGETLPYKIEFNTPQVTSVWLHLSQRESDHTNLFDLMINAFSQRQKIKTMPSTLGTGEDIDRQVDIVISILASILEPVVLVFDNLESLDNNAPSYLIIKSIINHICSTVLNIRLFLISREFPPINISKLKIEHSCLIIKNEELAFTYEETEQFLKRHYNNEISFDLVKKIHAITEGWPGGVALISESLSKSDNTFNTTSSHINIVHSANTGKPAKTNHSDANLISSIPTHLTAETLEYFSSQIYAFLPENIQNFLIRASMFDDIDEDMAAHLCDTDNGHEILSYLEKRNLFIQRQTSISTRLPGNSLHQDISAAPVYYRFNALFKQFLFKALIREISYDELKNLNLRAAHFFEKRGQIELAVHYYIEGQDYKMAGDMIKKCATDLLVKGFFPNIGAWIESLPERVVKNDPWLIYYLTVTRRIRGGRRNVEDFLTALNLFEANNDIRGCMLSTAHLIEAAVFVRKSPAKIAEWIKKGEMLLLQIRDKPYFNWARALLWQQIAFGYIAGEVDINKGLSSSKNARILAKRIRNLEIELNASIVMAFGYVRAGNFSGAQLLLREIQPLTHEDIHPEYRALNYIIRIDFALKQGAFDEAERYLEESEKDVERFGLIFLYPEFIELKAMHRIYTGRFREALDLADHLSDFSILSGNNFYLALAHHIKAVVYYHSGCLKRDLECLKKYAGDLKNKIEYFKDAQNESEKSLSLFNEKNGEDARFFAAKRLSALILIQQEMYQDAENALSKSDNFFDKLSSGISWCETRAVLGLLCWKQEQIESARDYILTALNRAFEEGYERFALISPSDFSEIVLLGISFDDSNTLFNALSPLIANQSQLSDMSKNSNSSLEESRFTEKNPAMQILALLKHPAIAGDINAMNRLKHLYRLTLPRVVITTLGQFSVCIKNQMVADNIWEGNKPKLLLKSIICHNTRDVSKDMIIDDIWPDASMKAGEKNFKINLHRLRKVLEPDVNKQVGYSYIKMDAGRISLDSELVSVDIDAFTSLVQQGYEKLAREEMALAILFFEQAVTFYKGDFLAEESYQAWIDLKRDSLRRQYIEILMTMARIYEEQEQPFQAVEYLKKAIQADPLHEEAYQNLMIVYADAGMIKAASALYERWRQTAISELGVEPDPETRNIYNKIQALHFKQNQVILFKKR
ncbi:MAG: hypothetical protein HQK70_02595 [Desulfamplus sp.]|nr:hypothetical protein [Desulfamplus sp.]